MKSIRFHQDVGTIDADPDFVAQYNNTDASIVMAECGNSLQPLAIQDDGKVIWLQLHGGSLGELQIPLGYVGCRDLPRTDKTAALYGFCRKLLAPLSNGDWVENPAVLKCAARWMRDIGRSGTEIRHLYDRPWRYLDEIMAAVADACLRKAREGDTDD
jgi:hypothetical protein